MCHAPRGTTTRRRSPGATPSSARGSCTATSRGSACARTTLRRPTTTRALCRTSSRRRSRRSSCAARARYCLVWFGFPFFALLCFALRRASDGAVVVPRTILRMCALHGGCSAVTWRLLLRMCALFPPNTPNGRESHARARRGGCDVAYGVARNGCDGCDGTRMRRSSTARTTRPAGTTGARATSSGRGGRPTRRPRGSSSGATV